MDITIFNHSDPTNRTSWLTEFRIADAIRGGGKYENSGGVVNFSVIVTGNTATLTHDDGYQETCNFSIGGFGIQIFTWCLNEGNYDIVTNGKIPFESKKDALDFAHAKNTDFPDGETIDGWTKYWNGGVIIPINVFSF